MAPGHTTNSDTIDTSVGVYGRFFQIRADLSRSSQILIPPRSTPSMQVARPEPPPANRGGSRGYGQEFRNQALALVASGDRGSVQASRSSLYRWSLQQQRMAQKGNGPKINMVGEHKLLLVMFRLAYPKAMASEIIQYIATNSVNPHIYSRSDITEAENLLGFSRKVGATTANQALLPINVIKRQMFWNLAPPLGVFGVNRNTLIDIDEAGIMLKFVNRKRGKALVGIEVRQKGIYGHRNKWTLIVAICPTGLLHLRFEKEPGTTTEIFNQFCDQLCNQFIAAAPQRRLIFDNLGSHLANRVVNTIHASGHTYTQRPPYRPCDGPIEFFFNMLQQELTHRMYLINNEADLRQQVRNIAQSLSGNGFDALFRKCGY